MAEEGLCFPNSWRKSPERLPPSPTLGLPSSSLFGEPATRLQLATLPSPYLQFGGVGGDVPGNLDHLALLTNEDPARAAAGVLLASRAAYQQNQQTGEDRRHLCLHICASLLHLQGRNAETSQPNSLNGRSAPKAGMNHVASWGMTSQQVSVRGPRSFMTLE